VFLGLDAFLVLLLFVSFVWVEGLFLQCWDRTQGFVHVSKHSTAKLHPQPLMNFF
jgi:hypothetical protein